jgi:hypothetical protein
MPTPVAALLHCGGAHNALKQTLDGEFGARPVLNAGQIHPILSPAEPQRAGGPASPSMATPEASACLDLLKAGQAMPKEWVDRPVSGIRLKGEF